eukprot:CAMPEP_0172440364 /NCGR_PEP_ID=MMETSP1065-20121228/1000_1 /TAXON_ID=265537 /ORGANISM="Amphiprora paludosa, Strain CCMP125" /LENGTH=974 /DNA_ID=CAMNT_0013189155 /DNA_START=177 /DNA_END=3101 /DNA_ORIENTATION=-
MERVRGGADPLVAGSHRHERALEEDQSTEFEESEILRDSLVIYGGLLTLIVLLFSFLRRRCPRIYNIRSWIDDLKTDLAANDQFGFFSWLFQVYVVTDDEIMQECGLDAACFVRLIQMGYRLSLVGIFNALWLLPVYLTAEDSSETESVSDRVVRTTVAHVPSSSPRLYATVIAAYILFGYTMYYTLEEFEWYTEMRHKFLRRPRARHHTIFCRNIPKEYQSSESLSEFFKQCFSDDAVLEATVPLQIPNLSRLVAQRSATLAKLEHAVAILGRKGVRPRHITVSGRNVDSIDHFTRRLDEQNHSVSTRIALLEEVSKGGFKSNIADIEVSSSEYPDMALDPFESEAVIDESNQMTEGGNENEGLLTKSISSVFSLVAGSFIQRDDYSDGPLDEPTGRNGGVVEIDSLPSPEPRSETRTIPIEFEESADLEQIGGEEGLKENESLSLLKNEGRAFSESLDKPERSNRKSIMSRSIGTVHKATSMATKASTNVAKSAVTNVAKGATFAASNVARGATFAASNVAMTAMVSASKVSSIAQSMILGEEGRPYSSGFVTFSKLSTANAALQMVQHTKPFAIDIIDAPAPQDVFWFNIGREHRDLQIGMIISCALTGGLCLLWTVPMSFFASLSNASAVREDFDWLDDIFDRYPKLIPLLEQLAPFLVVIFNTILPNILEYITMFEGPFSSGRVAASLFVKLSAFMIIQTFFVSAISGSVIQAINAILADWSQIIDLLANALPAQGTYFMQILLVSTTTSAGMELLRPIPIASAALRTYIGPNLTEKERNKSYMGLRPLCDPKEFEHADYTSQLVLYFMCLFVFAVISPILPVITAFCFAFMGAMFRQQFIHIYPKFPDSGGKLWANFIQIMLSCMFIAQVTIFGLLGLKKGVKQLPLYIPLMCITVLFNLYIRQNHFRVARYLPTRECLKADLARDFSTIFERGAYVQPQLKADKEVQPDSCPSTQGNMTDEEQFILH